MNLPKQSRCEVNNSNFLKSEGEGVENHANKGEEVDGEGGGLVGVGLVQDDATDHGARHATHHNHQPNHPSILCHTLKTNEYEMC